MIKRAIAAFLTLGLVVWAWESRAAVEAIEEMAPGCVFWLDEEGTLLPSVLNGGFGTDLVTTEANTIFGCDNDPGECTTCVFDYYAWVAYMGFNVNKVP
jgi:hypothetical protein